MDVHEQTAANRVLLADFFDGLTQEQLESPSLCEAWTVRDVLGHVVMPLTVSLGGLLLRTVRSGGSVDRASVALAKELAEAPVPELTSILRLMAPLRVKAPGVGPMGQMADGCIHLRDCARPLGLPADVGLEDWRTVLEWLPTKQASRGVVPRRRLEGLSLRATDQAWVWGTGREVVGPSEALALAVAGRPAALVDLAGPGLDILRAKVDA